MGHNISQGRRDREERNARFNDLARFIVPGWTIDPVTWRIVAVPTVAGALHRGEVIIFRCQREDCRRRVELDLRSAVHAGHGHQHPSYLLAMLKCQHWRQCGLQEASATYPRGVPLVSYLQHSDVLIAIACTACRHRVLMPPREVIERLMETHRGDGSTGILELAGRVRGPCRACGGRAFETSAAWGASRP